LVEAAVLRANEELVVVCLLRDVGKCAVNAAFVVVCSDLSLYIDHRSHLFRLVLPHDVVFFDLLALQWLQPYVHNGAAHLNNSGLRGLQDELVLNLDQRAELRHVVLNRELLAVKNNLSVCARRRNVVDAHVLVVCAADFKALLQRGRRQQEHHFGHRLVDAKQLEHQVVLGFVGLHLEQRVLAARELGLEAEGEDGLADLALEAGPHEHLDLGALLLLHFGLHPLAQARQVHVLDAAAAQTALDQRVGHVVRGVPAEAAERLLRVVADLLSRPLLAHSRHTGHTGHRVLKRVDYYGCAFFWRSVMLLSRIYI
jgi:hypothetical protein